MSLAAYCLGLNYYMSEPYAFYTSTNTYRNPIFDGLDEASEPESVASQDEPGDNRKRKVNKEPESGQPANGCPPKPSSSKRVTLISNTRERCAEICDNLAFSARDKLFVMETNFKRRLRTLRRFLDGKLPPWLLSAGKSGKSRDQQTERTAASSAGPSYEELAYERGAPMHSNSSGQQPLFNLSEPISAKALGIQQERILSRLERIKRDNQKLSSSCSLHSSRQWPPTWLDSAESSSLMSAEDGARNGKVCNDSLAGSARCLPKSASSPDAQVTVPFWLTRPAEDETCTASASATAASSSCGAHELAAEPARPGAADVAKTATSRPSPFSKCARATSGFISSVQAQTKRKVREAVEQKKTCIVCYERTPNITTLPCEHSDVCSECFIEIIYRAVKSRQYPLRCVLCRAKVERIRCSRRLMLTVIGQNRTKRQKVGMFTFSVRP